MCTAFLVSMGFFLEAIKKNGYLEANKDANEIYVEQRKLVKQAKAAQAKFD
jgi:hypothetical protein